MDTEIGPSLAPMRPAEKPSQAGCGDGLADTIGAPRSAGGRAWLQARIFNRLALVRGAVVPLRDLIDAAYGGEPEGGPQGAIGNIRITIFRLRRRGVQIKIVHGRGYVLL